jgi:hypothetical protein
MGGFVSHTIILSDEEFVVLNLALGAAAGAAFEIHEKKLAFSIVRLANSVNRDNPNWTPYQLLKPDGSENAQNTDA